MPYTNHSRFEKLMKRTGVDVMKKLEQLYEGKAKKVFATEDPDVVIVDYKDDATAFNGPPYRYIVQCPASASFCPRTARQQAAARG